MKTINVTFTEKEMNRIKRAKVKLDFGRSWHDFILYVTRLALVAKKKGLKEKWKNILT